MLKFRTIAIGLFALAGAILAVVLMPGALDQMFEAIKSSSVGNKSLQPTVQIDQYSFKKVIFKGDTVSAAERSANEALSDLKSKKTTINEICAEKGSNSSCEDVEFTNNALKRPELQALTKLTKSGDMTILVEESPSPTAAIYYLKEFALKTKSGTLDENQAGYPGSRLPLILMAFALLGATVGVGIGNLFFRLMEVLSAKWGQMETGDKVNLFLGIVTGIIVSLPFLFMFSGFGPVVASFATIGLTIGFSVVAVYALNSVADVLPWKKGEVRGRRSGIKVLDTNVLIDGRIYDLARTGFLEGEIYVPKFVLQELQHIADSADSLRRQRGRRGLEVLKHIQSEHPVEIGTHDRLAGDSNEEVDARLVRLAMALGADLVSNDYNLNRVASIQNVRVLNINDLALSLRPNVLPGEMLDLTIIKEGSQLGQGVGYLEDGTMVVVENGRDHVGESLEVVVTQVIQTERGKMIFGALDEEDEKGQKRNSLNRR